MNQRWAPLFLLAAVSWPLADCFGEAQMPEPTFQVPEFSAPSTLDAWPPRKAGIRATLTNLLGSLPPRPPRPAVQTIFRQATNGYIFEKFQFSNAAGATVPGYLFIPAGTTGPVPCVLYCHWHGGQYHKGKEEMLEAEHTPEIPAKAFTAHGYAVAGIDAYGFGERSGQGPGGPEEKGGREELSLSKLNLWLGRTLWGMILRDDLMLLDYLCSRPEIDRERIGVTGISMGSTRSWWLMALDDRLKAGVGVACLTRYQNLVQERHLAAHGIYYFVPGVLRHFDTEAMIALIAPRPVLFLTGDKDDGSPAEGIRVIETKVRPVYELHHAAANFQNVLYPGVGHVYLPEMWQRMFSWMDRHLKGQGTPAAISP